MVGKHCGLFYVYTTVMAYNSPQTLGKNMCTFSKGIQAPDRKSKEGYFRTQIRNVNYPTAIFNGVIKSVICLEHYM